MTGTTHLGSFYTHQTQVGSPIHQQAVTGRTRRDYAAFDLGGSIDDALHHAKRVPQASFKAVKPSVGSWQARLDDCSEWIADFAHPSEHPGELRNLKRFRQVTNFSGYRAWDQQLVGFWVMKRARKQLMDLTIGVELDGQFQLLDVAELFRLADVCFAPYLLFHDIKQAARYGSVATRMPDCQAMQAELDRIYLKKVAGSVGWGLFAREAFASGAKIGDYTGVVHRDVMGGAYCMEYDVIADEALVVDARYFGNHTRFVNHDARSANLEARSLGEPSHGRGVGVFSTCPIRKGEQLLLDYGPGYWAGRPVQSLES